MTSQRAQTSAPQLLTEKEAAAYCGVEVGAFRALCPIKPVTVAGGGQRWELRALDGWIDFLSAGDGPEGAEGAEKLRLQ